MSERVLDEDATWRWRVWSAVVRLPMWAYFVVAILLLLIGLVGLLLDQGLAWLARLVTYPE